MNILTTYNEKYFVNVKIEILKKTSYEFRDWNLCFEALTHSSLKNEKEFSKDSDNEKLEFIGDAVFDLIASNFLLLNKEYSQNEGKLSINRAKIVNEKSLSKFANKLSLGKFLRVSSSAYKTKIYCNESVLSDTFEAFVGAIFLDSNFETVEKIILRLFERNFHRILEKPILNYKSILNEYLDKRITEHPVYEIVEVIGPDHKRIYKSQISIAGKVEGYGKGNSIKIAEQNAAKHAVKRLGIINDDKK